MQLQQEFLVVSKDDTQMIIKGKRTKRQRAPSPLRLLMPNSTSSSTNNSNSIDSTTTTTTIELRQDEDMANCLILLAQGRHHVTAPASRHDDNENNNDNNDDNKSTRLYLYQCKTCNRCFPSFQALGGHRASHKKPRQNGTFSEAVTTFENNIEENINDRYDPTTSTTLSLKIPNTSTGTVSTTKAKAHECSICGAEFSSGQALGGHMRRHRSLVHASMTTSMSGGNVVAGGSGSHEYQEAKKPFKLDLNLPAPDDDHRESKFSFQQREKVIVFSKSSLVDCHY
ncbi:zinc finger protein ZAT5 [Cajanus cajan]|uniref:zinc finger protein ZAT5 n=1 Tax=Cajanus cajan TaxID=3821 RepID=UPI00098D87F7|nr:zinc finger protein ZAT5 [Cajanus cajan]